MNKDFSPWTEFWIGILALILLFLFGDFLSEIPIIGWIFVSVGWIIPIALIWSGWDRLKKEKPKTDISDFWPPR